MELNFSGEIKEQRFVREFNFGSENLGTCWVQRKPKNLSNDWRKVYKLINTSNGRTMIIPTEQEELIDYLVKKIEKAREVVCLSSFLIQESSITDSLLRASERGVNIFILTAKEEDLKKAEDELTDYEKENIESHKHLLDSFAGKILVRTFSGFHAKYLIIDPNSDEPFGFIMTCNTTVEAMSGKNIEISLSLFPEETNSLFSHFLHGFWEMADHELLEKGKLTGVKRDVDLNLNLGEVKFPSTFFNNNSLRENILEIIKNASTSLIIGAWSFDPNYVILDALEEALERNVLVYIYTRPNFRNTKALSRLLEKKGVYIYGQDRYHAKYIIADENYGLITTSNFTKLGLDTGFEVSVHISRDEIDSIKEILVYWDNMCEWMLNLNTNTKNLSGSIRQYKGEKDNYIEIKVIPQEIVKLNQFTVESCEKMLKYEIPENEIEAFFNKNPEKKYKKITFTKEVLPPKLPLYAIEDKKKNRPFPVYYVNKGNKKYIIVKKWEEIEEASRYAQNLNAKIVVRYD